MRGSPSRDLWIPFHSRACRQGQPVQSPAGAIGVAGLSGTSSIRLILAVSGRRSSDTPINLLDEVAR